jgi:thiol-disulfide isomerase/thioredoxin
MKRNLIQVLLFFVCIAYVSAQIDLSQISRQAGLVSIKSTSKNKVTISVFHHLERRYKNHDISLNDKTLVDTIYHPHFAIINNSKDSLKVLLTANDEISVSTDQKGKISVTGTKASFTLDKSSLNNPLFKNYVRITELNQPDKKVYSTEIKSLLEQNFDLHPEMVRVYRSYLNNRIRYAPAYLLDLKVGPKIGELDSLEAREFKNILANFGEHKEKGIDPKLEIAQELPREKANKFYTLESKEAIKYLSDSIYSILINEKIEKIKDLIPSFLEVERAKADMTKYLAAKGLYDVNKILMMQDTSKVYKNKILDNALTYNTLNIFRNHSKDNIGILRLNLNKATDLQYDAFIPKNNFQTYLDIQRYVTEKDTTGLGEIELKIKTNGQENPYILDYISRKKLDIANELKNIDFEYQVFENPTKSGQEILDLLQSKYKGKVVYLDVWATWCGPCKSEFEKSKPMKEHFADKSVAFIYLCGGRCKRDAMEREIRKYKIAGDHYLLTSEQQSYIFEIFKTGYFPTYKLIDKTGRLLEENAFRPSQLSELIGQVEPLLK